MAPLGGRHAARRRSHGAGRADRHRRRPSDHRAHPGRVYCGCAGHHLLPAQRADRGALLCRRLARQPRRGPDAAALSVRHATGDPARTVALRLRRGGQRRRDAVAGARGGSVRPPHLAARRLPARLDLRACLYGEGPAGAWPGPRRGARLHQLSEIRRHRREPAARRGEGVCLGPLADRSLPAGLRLPRVQRGRGRAPCVRRRAAACRRRRAQVAEPPLRQPDRLGRAAGTRTISTSPTASRSPMRGPPTT